MRRVTINNSLQKARDTSRVYELLLFDDNKQTIVSENDNVTVKIGNRTGFLLDIEPGIADGAITIDSAKFADLPADDYRLEIWMYRNDKLYIYPDDKQITLRLSSTLNDITGTMLSTITIEQLRKELAENGGGGVSVVGPQGEPGPKGDKGEKGADGKSAYQVWIDLGNAGSEQDFIDSLKSKPETATRHAPTAWTLDRTTTPWTIWLDNGCGLQFPEYATTNTVYGYGFSSNLNSTDFVGWPLIPNVIRAARGAITVDKFKKQNSGFDYWSPTTKVINPIQDASKFDWANAFGDEGTNSGSYGRKPVFTRVMYELGIWSDNDVISLGATGKEV